MPNDPTHSSFIRGLDRCWDKEVCGGQTTLNHQFALIYDTKSAKGWIIYRLANVQIAELEG